MLVQLGHEASAVGVAKIYSDFVGTLVIDPVDKSQSAAITKLGLKVAVVPTVMETLAQKRKLARTLLQL